MASPLRLVKAAAACVAAVAVTANGIRVPRQDLEAMSAEQMITPAMTNAYFPSNTLPGDQLFPMPKCYGETLFEATIDDVQKLLSSGRLNSKKLVECYLNRFFQIDEYTK